MDRFLEADVQHKLALPFAPRSGRALPAARAWWTGAHTWAYAANQPDLVSIGIAIPVGRMRVAQMQALAQLPDDSPPASCTRPCGRTSSCQRHECQSTSAAGDPGHRLQLVRIVDRGGHVHARRENTAAGFWPPNEGPGHGARAGTGGTRQLDAPVTST